MKKNLEKDNNLIKWSYQDIIIIIIWTEDNNFFFLTHTPHLIS